MTEPEVKKSVLDVIKDTIAELVTKVDEMSVRLDEVEKRPYTKKRLFGGKAERHPIVDTTNNVVYVSMSAAGKALAGEAGTAPDDHFAFYKLQSKFPERFRDATEEEAGVAQAEEDARIAAAVQKAEDEEKAAAAKEVADKAGKPSGKK